MGKIYTCFRIKKAQNPNRWGSTYLYSLYKGVPPGFWPCSPLSYGFYFPFFEWVRKTGLVIKKITNFLKNNFYEVPKLGSKTSSNSVRFHEYKVYKAKQLIRTQWPMERCAVRGLTYTFFSPSITAHYNTPRIKASVALWWWHKTTWI